MGLIRKLKEHLGRQLSEEEMEEVRTVRNTREDMEMFRQLSTLMSPKKFSFLFGDELGFQRYERVPQEDGGNLVIESQYDKKGRVKIITERMSGESIAKRSTHYNPPGSFFGRTYERREN